MPYYKQTVQTASALFAYDPFTGFQVRMDEVCS